MPGPATGQEGAGGPARCRAPGLGETTTPPHRPIPLCRTCGPPTAVGAGDWGTTDGAATVGAGDGGAPDGVAAAGGGDVGAVDGTVAAEHAPTTMVAANATPRAVRPFIGSSLHCAVRPMRSRGMRLSAVGIHRSILRTRRGAPPVGGAPDDVLGSRRGQLPRRGYSPTQPDQLLGSRPPLSRRHRTSTTRSRTSSDRRS